MYRRMFARSGAGRVHEVTRARQGGFSMHPVFQNMQDKPCSNQAAYTLQAFWNLQSRQSIRLLCADIRFTFVPEDNVCPEWHPVTAHLFFYIMSAWCGYHYPDREAVSRWLLQ